MNEREESESVLLYHCPTCGATHLDPVEDTENAALRQQLAEWKHLAEIRSKGICELTEQLAEAKAEVERQENRHAEECMAMMAQRQYDEVQFAELQHQLAEKTAEVIVEIRRYEAMANPPPWKLWGSQVMWDVNGDSDANDAVPICDAVDREQNGDAVRPLRCANAYLISRLRNYAVPLLDAAEENSSLRAQLAERDAVLRECRKYIVGVYANPSIQQAEREHIGPIWARIDALLGAMTKGGGDGS